MAKLTAGIFPLFLKHAKMGDLVRAGLANHFALPTHHFSAKPAPQIIAIDPKS
jgi:hypothetical protein